ncbi:hypothetical protein KXQ82_14490 [Mucilaginibacter sp. HMF5004]|uniref:hypothetical protein n=1 Tax=Mucilaginibacter rivuli TaxID=2857527 RepID=UPI001C5F1949|nr:hypothetical protein [Mucilaginibacter rivuli]MBW4890933.1 hypothetical protein [Mucilaginibacter rivuli]
MFSLKSKPYRILLLVIGTITLMLGVLIFVVPPNPFPDPSWGFQVMRYMEQGHAFNLIPSPNPANIAIDNTDFLSWWSPGQYLLPYLFKIIFGLNTGKAVALTVTLCSILGLAGYYQLFKRLGFTNWLSAISIAFIASQAYFILPFIFYPGGEVLLFAFGGWFLYYCFGIQKLNWQAFVFLFLAGLLGFVAKSSVLWMYAAGVACVWINLSASKKNIQHWLRNGVLLAIPVLAAVAIIYFCYITKGVNPSNADGPWLIMPETFSFPLASPLLSGLSIDEIFNGLIYHPDAAILSYTWSIVLLALLAFGSVFFVNSVLKHLPNKDYALALIIVYITGTLFFSYLYIKQADVSFEGRHFRVIGLLTIPGLIYWVSKSKIARIVFGMVWFLFICWETSYFKIEYKVNIHSGHGPSGLSQQAYDQLTLNELSRLDSLHPNTALFVTTAPDLAIEIRNNRVLTLSVQDMSAQELKEVKYTGKAGTIYMLMPEVYQKNGVAYHISKAFVNYHHFTVKKLGNNYLYSAEN